MPYVAVIAAGLIGLAARVAESQAPTPESSASPATQDVAVLQRECKAGKPSACRALGDVYRAGTGPTDKARAADFYKQACDGRDAEGCYALGLLYFHGSGVAKDPTRSAALFKQGCDAGVQLSCTSLGLQYDKGIGLPKSSVGANLLWELACGKGEPLACQNRAIAFREDEKNFKQADVFFRKACDGGMNASCEALGVKFAIEGRRPPSELKEVCARHILIKVESPSQGSASDAKAKARRRAEAVLSALKAGTDFAELARKFSEDESNAKGGGNLGCFARGVLVQSFENVAFALKMGETSDVVRTDFGFHVIQRVAK